MATLSQFAGGNLGTAVVQSTAVNNANTWSVLINTWTSFNHNHIPLNNKNIVTLSTGNPGSITLKQGDYIVEANVQPYTNSYTGMQLRLQNITANSTIVKFTNAFIGQNLGYFGPNQGDAIFRTGFTLPNITDCNLQIWCGAAQGGSAFNDNSGQYQVAAQMVLQKIG